MVDGLNQALVLGQLVPEQTVEKEEKEESNLLVREVQVPQEEGWGEQVVLLQPVQAQLQERVVEGQERVVEPGQKLAREFRVPELPQQLGQEGEEERYLAVHLQKMEVGVSHHYFLTGPLQQEQEVELHQKPAQGFQV
jgi:hypothetical protein